MPDVIWLRSLWRRIRHAFTVYPEVRGIEANVTESFHVVDECSFNNSWCDILDYYRLNTYQM